MTKALSRASGTVMALKKARAATRRYADGGSVSEEELYNRVDNPIDRLKADLIARNSRAVPPEEIARNTEALKTEALGMLPVVGNVMAARDSGEVLQDAVKDFRAGNYFDAWKKKAASKAIGLSALLGLPTSRTAGQVAKTAKDTARVFVPAVDDAASDTARDLRYSGAKNATVAEKTGRLFSAEGRLLEEIPDRDMRIRTELIKPEAKLTLGQVIEHPQLFEQFPHLRDKQVHFSNFGVDGKPFRGALQKADGSFLLSAAPDYDHRGDIAKLLQYQLSAEHGLAPAVRHSATKTYDDLANTVEKVAGAKLQSPADLKAMAAFLERTQGAKSSMDLLKNAGSPNDAARWFGQRSSGNVLAKRVQSRASMPEERLQHNRYVFGPADDTGFTKQIPLIPRNATPEQTMEALRGWREFGAGRVSVRDKLKGFANGGAVRDPVKRAANTARRRLSVGAVKGVTPGRSDELPVALPEGAYVIPADIVSALGEGNTAAGFKKLDARFPKGRHRKATAVAKADGGAVGSVEAIVSDGEFIISPADVAALGGGDIDRGHAVLDIFVKGTRAANIKRLQSIPDPSK